MSERLRVHPQKFKLNGVINENIICSVISPYTFDPNKKYEIAMNWVETEFEGKRIIIIPFLLKMYRMRSSTPVFFEKYFNLCDEKEYTIFERFLSQTIKKKEILTIFVKSLEDENKKPDYIKIPIRSNNWKKMSQGLSKLKLGSIEWDQDEFKSFVAELKSDFKNKEALFRQIQNE